MNFQHTILHKNPAIMELETERSWDNQEPGLPLTELFNIMS